MATNTDSKGGITSDDQAFYDSDRVKQADVNSDTPVDNASVQDELTYQFSESRKLGITSSVFVILNKMIGTGTSGYASEAASTRPLVYILADGGLSYVYRNLQHSLRRLRSLGLCGRLALLMDHWWHSDVRGSQRFHGVWSCRK
jgi:hypothetical protein